MTDSCFGDLGAFTTCWGYKLKVDHRNKDEVVLPKNVHVFSYKSLQKATDNFSTWVARDGLGISYKGILEDGTSVNVKVFDDESIIFYLFSLIKTMSRIKHRNVAEFIGCCAEGGRKIFVHEFTGEHNLYDLLFDPGSKNVNVSWSMRASICLGIARGLEYLHHGISPCVVHRDIKPRNVLLDENFNPKIMNFDISHPLEDDLSHCRAPNIVGTLGYIDPEYCITGIFTEKADNYGFGILLLEVITGRKSAQILRDNEDTITLVDWVWKLQKNDKIVEVADPTLDEFPEDELR